MSHILENIDKLIEQIKKRCNNYTLAIFCAFVGGISIGLVLELLAHLAQGIMPELVFDLIFFLPLFVSQVVSGVGYLFTPNDIIFYDNELKKERTFLDLLNVWKTQWRKAFSDLCQNIQGERAGEFIGLLFGLGIAIGLTVTEIVMHLISPLGATVSHVITPAIGYCIEFIFSASAYMGFFNRCGRFADAIRKSNKVKENESLTDWCGHFFKQDRINYTLSVLGGILVGLALSAIILGIVGVVATSSAFTFGGAVPVWVGATIFVLSTTGVCTSASTYVGRTSDTLFGNRTLLGALKGEKPKETLWERLNGPKKWEARLTIVGVVLGVSLGVGLIAAGIVSLPFFGSGLPPLFSGMLLLTFCVSAMGGIGNRLGAAVDKAVQKNNDLQAQAAMARNQNQVDQSLVPRPDVEPSSPGPRARKEAFDEEYNSFTRAKDSYRHSSNPHTLTYSSLSAGSTRSGKRGNNSSETRVVAAQTFSSLSNGNRGFN